MKYFFKNKQTKRIFAFTTFLLGILILSVSCEKDELIDYYGDSKDSYVKTCDKCIKLELQRAVRDGSNVVLTYKIWTDRLGETYASMWTGPWDGSASVVGSDDTGCHYKNGYPNSYGNIEIYIDGRQVGTYGNGQMFTLNKERPVYGRVVFKLVSKNATAVTVRIPITSNTPNLTFSKDQIEFVNIPIEEVLT